MTKIELTRILACPRCKNPLKPKKNIGKCQKCKFPYKFEDGIWELLYTHDKKTKKSQTDYDRIHQKVFGGPTDGSYEILASFARGNKTVDIACGQGHIEKLSPETVGVEFSKNALIKARASGVQNLVLADAHALPFVNNSFDLSISTGNLEHFQNPQKTINEMARISKIQILIVHRHPPIPFADTFFHAFSKIFNIIHQPIEKPIDLNSLIKMTQKAGLHIIYKGVWTLPVNYGNVIRFLPEFKNVPACSFVISIKK